MTLPPIFAGGRRRLFASLALNGICQAGATLLAAVLLSRSLANGGLTAGRPSPELFGLLLIAVAVVALRTFERAQAERLGQLYVTDCRSRLFAALSDLPFRGGPKVRYGIMMTRLITDLTSLKNWVARGIAKLLVAGISLSGVLAALHILVPALSVVTGAVVLGLIALGTLAAVLLRRHVLRVRQLRGRLAGNIAELAPARGLLRHYGRLDRERTHIRRQSESMSDALVQRGLVSGFMRSLSDAVMPVALVAAALAASYQGAAGVLTSSTLAIGLFLIGLSAGPIRDIMLALEYWANFSIGRAKLERAFAQSAPVAGHEGAPLPTPEEAASVELAHVGLPCLRAPVTARLNPGEAVLLQGPSGSGKSSLLFAIAGLAACAPGPGSVGIAIDGCDMNSATMESWHRRVKLISPELPLLKGSLSRNLRYANPQLDDPELLDLLARCCVHMDAHPFPDGLRTRLEEGARNLPAGLRSRISLARAVAAKPGLLLIDDPNFLLDDECRTALRNVVGTKEMSLVVAAASHTTLMQWDQIWRLHEGALQACGGDVVLRTVQASDKQEVA